MFASFHFANECYPLHLIESIVSKMQVFVTILFGLSFYASLSAADKRPNFRLLAVEDSNNWIGCLESTPQQLSLSELDRCLGFTGISRYRYLKPVGRKGLNLVLLVRGEVLGVTMGCC